MIVCRTTQKIVRGSGWAEGLELSSGRNPLRVEGLKGRVRRLGVSADYKKRFRSRGVLLDWLKANRKGSIRGKVELAGTGVVR